MPSAPQRLITLFASFVVAVLAALPPGARAQSIVASLPEAAGTAIAVNPATNRIYVAADPAVVKVVDGDSHALVATIPVQRGPAYIAVNRVTNRIFVANTRDQSLSVIDGATNSVGASTMSPERLARRASAGFAILSSSFCLLGLPFSARDTRCVEMRPRLK